jgi:hypothetical protein
MRFSMGQSRCGCYGVMIGVDAFTAHFDMLAPILDENGWGFSRLPKSGRQVRMELSWSIRPPALSAA